MPIRFRCPGCEGLLSIATRKAGAEIGCPKCGEGLIVPPPSGDPQPDVEPAPPPEPPARGGLPDIDADGRTEMTLTPPHRRPASAGMGGPSRRDRGGGSGLVVRNFLDGDEPPAVAAPKPPAARPKPKLHKPGEEPLFERSDFEQLLEPGGKKAVETADAAKAEPTKPQPAIPVVAADAVRMGLPVAEDGVYVARGTAVMLGVLFLILLGLAFAAGFWAGSS